MGQRVADRRAVYILDRGIDPAHLTGAKLVQLLALGREHADVAHFVGAAGGHHQQLVAGPDLALHDAHQRHHAQIVVEPGVDDQRLQPIRVARLRRGNARNDRFQHLDHIEPGLRTDGDRVGGIDADHRLDLELHFFDVGSRQVDLVQYRHHFQPHLHRGVAVRHRLRFDALRRVDHQQRAFTGGQRAADLVGKVDVTGSVDEVELIGLPVARGVRQRHRLCLDGDAALAFDRIGVQHLRFHLAIGQAATELDDAIGQRGFAVIDMGNDGEVADQFHGALAACRTWVSLPRTMRSKASRRSDANPALSHGTRLSPRRARSTGRPTWTGTRADLAPFTGPVTCRPVPSSR